MAETMMTTREVADYLRIKERKVYDLVREKRIPCARVTGKWLFPKSLIDVWIARGTEFPDNSPGLPPAPQVAVGSHDPLLEWAIRESRCELPLLPGGSLDGLRRILAGEAWLCGTHVIDVATGEYNVAALGDLWRGQDLVLLQWARRRQGLIVAPGNPLGLRGVADLAGPGVRVVPRQPEAGSQVLLEYLLEAAGVSLDALDLNVQPARNESDLALAVQEGAADAGLGIEAVARLFRLDFVPLHEERFDLLVRRREFFEPPIQTLMNFARTPAFAARAAALGGYDVSGNGQVMWNAS